MPVRLGDDVKVSILVGDEEVHAFFPPYSNPEMAEAIRKLAQGRTVQKRGTVQDKSFDARVRFFNTMCLRVENVQTAEGELTPDVENWRNMVPANWKVSFSLNFEEKATLTDDDVGN